MLVYESSQRHVRNNEEYKNKLATRFAKRKTDTGTMVAIDEKEISTKQLNAHDWSRTIREQFSRMIGLIAKLNEEEKKPIEVAIIYIIADLLNNNGQVQIYLPSSEDTFKRDEALRPTLNILNTIVSLIRDNHEELDLLKLAHNLSVLSKTNGQL